MEVDSRAAISVPGAPVGVPTTAFFRVGSADYFKALGIPVLSGCMFDGSERTDSAIAEISVVINEALAKIYYPKINPVGQVMTGAFGMPERILGVVGNVAEANLTDPPTPGALLSHQSVAWNFEVSRSSFERRGLTTLFQLSPPCDAR